MNVKKRYRKIANVELLRRKPLQHMWRIYRRGGLEAGASRHDLSQHRFPFLTGAAALFWTLDRLLQDGSAEDHEALIMALFKDVHELSTGDHRVFLRLPSERVQ